MKKYIIPAIACLLYSSLCHAGAPDFRAFASAVRAEAESRGGTGFRQPTVAAFAVTKLENKPPYGKGRLTVRLRIHDRANPQHLVSFVTVMEDRFGFSSPAVDEYMSGGMMRPDAIATVQKMMLQQMGFSDVP